jgi:hypothetical protein
MHKLPKLIALASISGSCLFAITIDNQFTGSKETVRTDATTWLSSFTFTSAELGTFAAAGSDKLVLQISTKNDSNAGAAVSSLTYGGSSLTNVFQDTYSRSQQEFWYLDNVSSDGDLVINLASDTQALGLRLFALNGTAAGFVGDTNSVAAVQDNQSLPSLTTSKEAFVLWDASGNRSTTSVTTGTYSTDDLQFGGRGSTRGIWGIETAAGTFTETINYTNNSGGGITGIAFEAVPEPGSFALLAGMFGLTWVMLRRRS